MDLVSRLDRLEQMERFVARDSRQKMLVMLGGFIAGWLFLAWAATELMSSGILSGIFFKGLIGIGLILYTLYIVIVAYRVIKPGERIVIDDAGIFQKGWKSGAIPWRDIESAYARRSGYLDYLCLRVRNEGDYTKGMSDLSKAGFQKAGLTPFSLLVAGTDCKFDRLLEIVARKTAVERSK